MASPRVLVLWSLIFVLVGPPLLAVAEGEGALSEPALSDPEEHDADACDETDSTAGGCFIRDTSIACRVAHDYSPMPYRVHTENHYIRVLDLCNDWLLELAADDDDTTPDVCQIAIESIDIGVHESEARDAAYADADPPLVVSYPAEAPAQGPEECDAAGAVVDAGAVLDLEIDFAPINPHDLEIDDGLLLKTVRVSIDLDMDDLAGLTLTLTAPTGETILLLSDGEGEDLDVTFADEAPGVVPDGGPLGETFEGVVAAGVWTLTLENESDVDVVELDSWCIHFLYLPGQALGERYEYDPPDVQPIWVALYSVAYETPRVLGLTAPDPTDPGPLPDGWTLLVAEEFEVAADGSLNRDFYEAVFEDPVVVPCDELLLVDVFTPAGQWTEFIPGTDVEPEPHEGVYFSVGSNREPERGPSYRATSCGSSRIVPADGPVLATDRPHHWAMTLNFSEVLDGDGVVETCGCDVATDCQDSANRGYRLMWANTVRRSSVCEDPDPDDDVDPCLVSAAVTDECVLLEDTLVIDPDDPDAGSIVGEVCCWVDVSHAHRGDVSVELSYFDPLTGVGLGPVFLYDMGGVNRRNVRGTYSMDERVARPHGNPFDGGDHMLPACATASGDCLELFAGTIVDGEWTLTVCDNVYISDFSTDPVTVAEGRLEDWEIILLTYTEIPEAGLITTVAVPDLSIDDIRDIDIELVGRVTGDAQAITVTLEHSGTDVEPITLLEDYLIDEGAFDIRVSDADGICDDVEPVPEPAVDALAVFDGGPVAGTWTLTVTDTTPDDESPELLKWYLGIAPERCIAVNRLQAELDCESGEVLVTWENPDGVEYASIEIRRTHDGETTVLGTVDGTEDSFTDDTLVDTLDAATVASLGVYTYELIADCDPGRARNQRAIEIDCPIPFLRGDADTDGSVSGLGDGLFLIFWQFVKGADSPVCMDAADADDNGDVSGLPDGLFLLRWQFLPEEAALPPAPGPDTCGLDPDGHADGVRCDEYDSCP